MSDTFCILPWIHIYANADGSVIPCCIAHHHMHMGNVQTNTIEEIWNNDAYKSLRRAMLEGERSPTCRACYNQEELGVESLRQSINGEFEHLIPLKDTTNEDGSLDNIDLKYLDVRWSNICNFKCRSCSSTFSSSWAKEENKDNVYILAGGESNDNLYEQFEPHFASIEKFYFAGGEPLLTDKHYDILNHLINIGKTDVKIRYNTNLSVLSYKNQSVIELWKHFEDVQIAASLDSWGSRAEYIREGTVWKEIEQNILSIRKHVPHVNLDLNCVSSVFNVMTMTDFFDYILDNNLFDIHKVQPTIYNIQNPNYYRYTVLNDKLKQKAIQKLSSKSYSDKIDVKLKETISTLENTEYSPNDLKEFVNTTKKYDTLRNRDFSKTFPELNEIWSNC